MASDALQINMFLIKFSHLWEVPQQQAAREPKTASFASPSAVSRPVASQPARPPPSAEETSRRRCCWRWGWRTPSRGWWWRPPGWGAPPHSRARGGEVWWTEAQVFWFLKKSLVPSQLQEDLHQYGEVSSLILRVVAGGKGGIHCEIKG